MTTIKIGDAVKRSGVSGTAYDLEIGDVIATKGDRCQVQWRDREVAGFYRPEETFIRKGKKTWVREDRLVKVEEEVSCLTPEEKGYLEGLI